MKQPLCLRSALLLNIFGNSLPLCLCFGDSTFVHERAVSRFALLSLHEPKCKVRQIFHRFCAAISNLDESDENAP